MYVLLFDAGRWNHTMADATIATKIILIFSDLGSKTHKLPAVLKVRKTPAKKILC